MQGTRQPSDQGDTEAPSSEEFRLWETCMTINDSWGYHPSDRNFKSVGTLIRTLVDVVSKGGNFLLNVSPTPDGTIQPEFQERLRGVGKWMAVNGESIYGTTYGPWQSITFGRTTAKDKTIYLHVFDWPKTDLIVNEATQKITSATLLDGGKSLLFRQSGKHLTIKLPDNAPDSNVSVIKLQTE
jgi:alpha-L-fucosidase